MSYIIKTANALINAKLTDTGRKMLAQGQLNFTEWAFGDSEIDYFSLGSTYNLSNNKIIRPKDNNPDIKYRIPNGVTTTGDTNTLPQITPIEKQIVNTARTRGFFTGTTTAGFTAFTSSDYAYGTCTFDVTVLTGGTCLTVSTGTLNTSHVGDLLMIKMSNPHVTTTTATGVIEQDAPIPYLMYEIESVTTGSTSDYVCVDRALPNFSGATGTVQGFCILYPGGDSITNFYGSGSTTPYWNEDTLSFDSNCDLGVADVDVWNMNITNTLPVAGVDPATYESFIGYGSSAYTGSKLYFDLTYNDAAAEYIYQPAAGIIHYTNNTIANFYGEQLYISLADNTSPVLQLPTVMDYGASTGTTIGLTLTADQAISSYTPAGTENPNHILRYSTLRTSTDGRGVGTVFPDFKMFTISDMEINSVMSYKANRNWTLTPPSVVNKSALNNDGPFTPNTAAYVTYLLGSSSGYTTGLHCQTIQSLSSSTFSNQNIEMTFPNSAGFAYLQDLSSSGGLGYQADTLEVIYQIVTGGGFPNPGSWQIADITSQISGHVVGTPIAASNIYNSTFLIDHAVNTGATTYNLNDYITIPTTAELDKLQFGDERFFYGNMESEITATAYKSAFNFIGNANEFATSVNPTWDSTSDNVYIDSVGIYDSLGQLVVIGKLSEPIQKNKSKTIIVQLQIDF